MSPHRNDILVVAIRALLVILGLLMLITIVGLL